jgi:hypothetical protein
MKVLTLWQPWATLVIEGAKQFETRGWKPSLRQLDRSALFVMHAAKRDKELKSIYREATDWDQFFMTVLRELGYPTLNDMPMGAGLGVVKLLKVYPTEKLVDHLSEKEWYFGNYQPGRWAWRLKVVEKWPEPVPAKGAQGFWEWPFEIEIKERE